MTTPESTPASHEAELREHLRTELFQVREQYPDHFIHVILDPNHPVAPFDLLHPEHLVARKPKPLWKRIERPDLKHDPDICPMLVTIFAPGDRGYPDEALLNETIRCAIARCASINGAYVCGWVATTSDASQMASRIADRCVIANPLSGRKVLPWFEPHRLALIAGNHANMIDWMLAGTTRWWFVDAAATLRCVAAHETDIAAHVSVQSMHALWAEQERIADARRVLMALRKSERAIPAHPETRLDGLVKLANDQGLRGQQDVILFALNCLTLSPTWYEHPNIQQMLRDITSGAGMSLADAISAQTDAVLDEIAFFGAERALASAPALQ